jgi:hypothetical protein
MVYNTTGINSVTFIDFFIDVNGLAGGTLALFIMFIAFTSLTLLLSKNNRTDHAFIASSFITTLFGILLTFTGMLPFDKLAYPIIVFVGSILYTVWSGD